MKKKSAGDKHILMAALQGGESLIDTLVTNDIVKAIPVLSTAVGILKSYDDMRSAALKAKLLSFVMDDRLRKSVDAKTIRERLEGDDAESLGETLFLTLDKVTDLKKPSLLAKVFAGYLDGDIDRHALLLMAHTIDVAFIGDLEYFIWSQGSAKRDEKLAVERLASVGLFDFYVETGFDSNGNKHHQLSPLGSAFLHALKVDPVT